MADKRDAGFVDDFRPVRLLAQDSQDLAVISALMQDAVVLPNDIGWLQGQRRFALVANRFRWEDPEAEERVRAGLHAENVRKVRSRGVDAEAQDKPISVLSLTFEPNPADEDDPSGTLRIACAGGAEFLIEVEALEVAMRDMTKPWAAKSRPEHEADEDV
ncbi:MAG: DUF2948 family protein [Pseudomonadota bacterium]